VRSLAENLPEILDRGATIVFPSEVVAAHWRRAVLSDSSDVVREDRIISWDRFKEQAFVLREDRVPVNSTVRTIFAEAIIARNAANPFLGSIIPPEFSTDAAGFASILVDALPWLPLAESVSSRGLPASLDSVFADLKTVTARYREFLAEHELFEPRWLHVEGRFAGGDYYLVMPELAEDFDQYGAALAGTDRLEARSADPILHRYPDARQEWQDVMTSIGRLLDSGIEPEQVVLSVGGLDRIADRVLQAAELYSIPLILRHGRPLADSGPGRFFASIGDVVSDGFSISSVKRLLLNRSIPWKEHEAAEEAIYRGVEFGCLGGPSQRDSRWRHVPESDARTLIAALQGLLPAIVSSRSASDLRANTMRLLERMTDRSGWQPQDETIVQRCLDELNGLVALESETGLCPVQPYRFWADRLSERLYVPRQSGRGISLLPYRVGAGVFPDHHFVANAHQSAVAVRVSPLPFLADMSREQLGPEVAERDRTELFVRAYAASGAHVQFSSPEIGFEGPTLPPGTFLTSGERVRSRSVEWAVDPYVAEERNPRDVLGRDSDSTVRTVMPAQLHGADEYARTGPRVGPDRSQITLEDLEVIELAADPQRDHDRKELIRLSAQHLELFRACPFAYLLEKGLLVESRELEVDPDSAREMGSHYHYVLELFFQALEGREDAFNAERVETYVEDLMRYSDTLVAGARGMVLKEVYEANRDRFRRVLAAAIRSDAEVIDGHVPVRVEEWERREIADPPVVLIGRIDRVTRRPAAGEDERSGGPGLTVVDYKRRYLPSAKSLVGAIDADSLDADPIDLLSSVSTIQIPFYVSLLESGGQEVETAYYYGLESNKLLSVFDVTGRAGTPAMDRDQMTMITTLIKRLVRSVARRVRSGDYRCTEHCLGCAYRGICRHRFVVR
jgi:hypothetical protein